MAETLILLADNDQTFIPEITSRLNDRGYLVAGSLPNQNPRNLLLYLGKNTNLLIPNLVITDPVFWEKEPASGRVIAEMQELNPAVPVIVFSALNLQPDPLRFGNATILRKQGGIEALMDLVEYTIHPPMRVAVGKLLLQALDKLGQVQPSLWRP